MVTAGNKHLVRKNHKLQRRYYKQTLCILVSTININIHIDVFLSMNNVSLPYAVELDNTANLMQVLQKSLKITLSQDTER